jgi:hypothetical protein
MLNISFAGLMGAVVGTFIAAIAYAPLALLVERRMRSASPRRPATDSEIPIVLRMVLAADIFVFGGLGYWLGAMIGD